ncbi:MAG TPA: hypothetical protein VJQ43_04445 [Thermoplasmata archaeon]|nr:hypothetical protein [Thermoplasmata archaeon]
MRAIGRSLLGAAATVLLTSVSGVAAAGPTNLAETSPLVWVMVAISVAGALITYAFLAYAIWRYRDPHTRGRRYG